MKSNRKFTTLHRLLHWAISLALLILFITGFLHIYWMGKNHMAGIIENGTQNISISKDQIVGIAKSIRAPMWQWHIYAAYTMVALFLARIIYMIVKGIRFPNPFSGKKSLKERIEGGSYVLFYLFIGINVITGFYLLWGENREWKGFMSSIHIWAIDWLPIFIVIHLIGMYLAEISKKKGIVSKMIGGD